MFGWLFGGSSGGSSSGNSGGSSGSSDTNCEDQRRAQASRDDADREERARRDSQDQNAGGASQPIQQSNYDRQNGEYKTYGSSGQTDSYGNPVY